MQKTMVDNQKTASNKLKQKRKQLIASFLEGNELNFLEHNARLLDNYFREIFEYSMIGPKMNFHKNPYTIIALGGYGREEQCIHSDVDILFLFKYSIPAEAEELIREIIYPLWDIGLDIGYATRSFKECLSLAGEDFEVLTSVMDARFISGVYFLYSELIETLRKKIILKKSNKIITWLIDSNKARHIRFGDSTYLLEPNLKESQGGLRDYHTMLWLARIKFNLKTPRDLEYSGYLLESEFKALVNALAFIWKVRNHLHYFNNRKCDQLYFNYQIKLADTLEFKSTDGQEAVEKFLSKLHAEMQCIKNQHLMFLSEFSVAKKSFHLKKKLSPNTRVNGLECKRGMLNFVSSETVITSPDLLIKIFKESARLKISLSSESKRIIKDFLYLIDEDFRKSNSIIKIFESIMLTSVPTFNVLRAMLNTGFLTAFIPEFSGILNIIQYDEYHLYPVDKHSLFTVQTIKKFGTSNDPTNNSLCGELWNSTKNKKLLLWAGLLHDIGKKESKGNHSEKGAEIIVNIFKRMNYKPEFIKTISFLIKNHLLLIKTATRRDINDEQTIILCAREIKKINHLKMLYLLTVADSIATGPKAWNEWTNILLRDLFFKIMSTLKNKELATDQAVKIVEKKKAFVLNSVSDTNERQYIEELLNIMSPRYLLYIQGDKMLKHIELYKNFGNSHFVWNIDKSSDANIRIITICAKNHPGLFSKIAGVFTLNNLDILTASVYTWRNNTAIDIIEVKAPLDEIFEDEIWTRTKQNLEKALSGSLDLSLKLKEKMPDFKSIKSKASKKPNKIVIDTELSFFTIIEVITHDFPGLLFCITDVLFRRGLDVWIAKIATKVDQVVDVFYVRDFDGQKVDSPQQIAVIKAAIDNILNVYIQGDVT
ncbi:(Protein-PII) uridylyltransferase / (Protein-PII)-UMP uridylyl-removing enzyme [Candidatus Magnetomoraceae bacterium gMMP-1]